MFPLRRKAVILGDNRPAIGKFAYRRFARIDHRFNGKCHAGLQLQSCTGFAVVKNLRIFVKASAYSMAAKFADNGVTMLLGVRLNR